MTDLDHYFHPATPPALARPIEDRWTDPSIVRTAGTPGAMPAHGITAERLDAVLATVLDTVQVEQVAPRRPRIERLLVALRVPEPTARLLASTTGFRWAWIAAVTLVLVFAAAANGADQRPDQLAVFLALAPVVPVLGVLAAFSGPLDRTREVATAAPLSGLCLALLRTVGVVATAIGMDLLAVLASPTRGWMRLAWMLPSLALTSATLALGARVGLRRAAWAAIVAWLALVTMLGATLDDALAPYRAVGQSVAAAVAAAGIVMVLLWRRRFEWNWSAA